MFGILPDADVTNVWSICGGVTEVGVADGAGDDEGAAAEGSLGAAASGGNSN